MTPDQLRELLADLNLSQRAAARHLGIRERLFRRYAAGSRPIPPVVELALEGLKALADRGAP